MVLDREADSLSYCRASPLMLYSASSREAMVNPRAGRMAVVTVQVSGVWQARSLGVLEEAAMAAVATVVLPEDIVPVSLANWLAS